MGILNLFDSDDTHYECRRCGRNLSDETDACPECGGRVVAYEVS